MRPRLLTYVFTLLLALVGTTASAQTQQVRVTGAHVDELGELPADMRLGVFVVDRGLASDEEVVSVRMVAGTFDLTIGNVTPDERQLRPLLSGSFPLAFMIGNEFVTDREGVRFATVVMHPYQDRCESGAFDPLYDPRYGTTIPELPNFGGFFNLVYVTDPIVLRATAAEFPLQRGWNAIVSRFVNGRLTYEVASTLDIVIVTTGPGPATRELLPCP
jgi:hypothetical protein